MRSDLSPAVDAAFSAFGLAAVYVPPQGGPGVAVTVVQSAEDVTGFAGQRRIMAPRGRFELRAAELGRPERGGMLTIGGQVWRVTDEPEQPDPERLLWRLSCALEQASAPGAAA